MKKIQKLTVLILALAMALSMAGCSSKTYSSLEEWYADNSMFDSTIQSMMNSEMEGGSVEFAVEDNSIVYRYKFDEQTFGLNSDVDTAIKQTLDSNLETQRSTFTQLIDEFAKSSKIDVSAISVKLEYYNPGATTPSFTQSITK